MERKTTTATDKNNQPERKTEMSDNEKTQNQDRAERFAGVLPYYARTDEHTNAIDLLADCQHWCTERGENFEELLRIARNHYEAERDQKHSLTQHEQEDAPLSGPSSQTPENNRENTQPEQTAGKENNSNNTPLTKTYTIHAWCDRPFFASIDIEANTPEEAITKARNDHLPLIEAEECSEQYQWEEFAAYDEHGRQLLRVLDPPIRLREAAPELLDALQCIKTALQHHRHWKESMAPHLMSIAEQAIDKAKPQTASSEQSQTTANELIAYTVQGGKPHQPTEEMGTLPTRNQPSAGQEAKTSNRPVVNLELNSLRLTIYANNNENDETAYRWTLSRRYRGEDGKLHRTSKLFERDMPGAATLLEAAEKQLQQLKQERGQNKETEQEPPVTRTR
jgi:hypothetical protein